MDARLHLPGAAPPAVARPLPHALAGFAGDVAVLAAITFALLFAALAVLRWSGVTPEQQPLLVMAITFAAMALAAWPLWRPLPAVAREASLASHLRVGAVVGVSAFVFSLGKRVLERQWFESMPEASNIEPVLAALTRQLPLALLLFVVLAPWVEELAMRRILLARMLARGWPRLGLLLSATLFAWLHEPLPRGDLDVVQWLWLLSGYWALGLLFAWVYVRTRSLAAAVTAHAVNNALAIAVLLLHS